MKMRRALAILGLMLIGSLAWAMTARYSSGANGILVTDVNTNTPFTDNHSGGTTDTFGATVIVVCSRPGATADACYIDAIDGVATTADDRIEPGACLSLTYLGVDGAGYDSIGSICAAGDTATFDIKAGR